MCAARLMMAEDVAQLYRNFLTMADGFGLSIRRVGGVHFMGRGNSTRAKRVRTSLRDISVECSITDYSRNM